MKRKFKIFRLVCPECQIYCPQCKGKGNIYGPICNTCHSSGLVRFTTTIETKVLKDKDKVCPKCKRRMKVVL